MNPIVAPSRENDLPLTSRLFQRVEFPFEDVQIWTAHPDSLSAGEVGEVTASLDTAEQMHATRFRFDLNRRRYLAAHGLLRFLLGDALGRSPADLVFEISANGKPAIVDGVRDGRSLHFNLSHSAGAAMFALAWDYDVGVDLESISHVAGDNEELSALAARVLSDREIAAWNSLANIDARRAAFLRAWTRKEAYVKATGDGVAHELREIELALDAAAPQSSLIANLSRRDEGSKRDWTIHDVNAPESFVAAIAFSKVNSKNRSA